MIPFLLGGKEMRKYIIIIISMIVLLEIITLVVFRQQFVQYFKNSTGALINAIMPCVIIIGGIIYLLRRH